MKNLQHVMAHLALELAEESMLCAQQAKADLRRSKAGFALEAHESLDKALEALGRSVGLADAAKRILTTADEMR